MSHKFKGERTLMRIFIGESDRCTEGPHKGNRCTTRSSHLSANGALLAQQSCAGSQDSERAAKVHTERILRLWLDLPIVVEVVETEDRIQEVLPELRGMIGGGLITLERARVILYRPADTPENERAPRHRRAKGGRELKIRYAAHAARF